MLENGVFFTIQLLCEYIFMVTSWHGNTSSDYMFVRKFEVSFSDHPGDIPATSGWICRNISTNTHFQWISSFGIDITHILKTLSAVWRKMMVKILFSGPLDFPTRISENYEVFQAISLNISYGRRILLITVTVCQINFMVKRPMLVSVNIAISSSTI